MTLCITCISTYIYIHIVHTVSGELVQGFVSLPRGVAKTSARLFTSFYTYIP